MNGAVLTEERMATTLAAAEDIEQVWREYKADPGNQDLRNRLVENYLPLVKYNGERIWARLPRASNWMTSFRRASSDSWTPSMRST